MKLIIDISDGIYKHVNTIQNGSIGAKQIINSVKNGIPVYKTIPSAEPKTGHWYIDERPESDREVICSNCEQPIFKYHKIDFDYRPKYCPNCSAKMQESEV